MNGPRYVPQDCPMCGKREGATRGDSAWGHTWLCCSDACGRAFGRSSKRCQLEVERAEASVRSARDRVLMWGFAYKEALERETGGQ